MGASKEYPITDHEFVPCGCGDPDCRYCAECKEQECFHQPDVPPGPRDVPLDEVFTWREDFGRKAKEAFGTHTVDCSPLTYGDLKAKCDKVNREADPFFENVFLPPVPLNGITVHMVKQGDVPDGVLRACRCAERVKD
jgi:hypothetical protein